MLTNVTYWLDATASAYSDKIGIIDPNDKLCNQITFNKIRDYALMIASCLVKKKYFKSPVAIYMEKSAMEVVTFLGVAYSGNFYSPIDVDMPAARIDTIFKTFEPAVIITKKEYEPKALELAGEAEILYLEDMLSEKVDLELVNKQRSKCCDQDLLYVLFTSGSTGVPKGVMICHQSVIDYIDWVEKEFEIDSDNVFGNQAPFYFDNSILDIYTTIKTGATLNLIPHNLFTWPVKLLEYIKNNNINTIFWVPSALIIVSKLHALSKVDLNGQLKTILFCGEVMSNKHLNIWRKSIPEAIYANLYGPTEITDVCTYYRVNRKFADDEPLPIGKVLPNCEAIILNGDRLIHDGEVGELCIRGTCLSKGYYGNPEKTDEVFVQNPLQNKYEEKIYRTGDLVKKNELGEIIYVGRKDNQIKHLGHRIELGEIETAITAVDGISQCCCIHDDNKDHLVAFVDKNINRDNLNSIINIKLPEYMLPNKVIYMEKLPLNTNGKIDRKELQKLI